nr:hypothetical protein GCM10020092_094900 [Actinoplanes digitatis]
MGRKTVRKVVSTVGVMVAGIGASLVATVVTAAPAQAAPVATSTLQTQLVTYTNNTRVRAELQGDPGRRPAAEGGARTQRLPGPHQEDEPHRLGRFHLHPARQGG